MMKYYFNMIMIIGLILTISCNHIPSQNENETEDTVQIRIEKIWENDLGGQGWPSTFPPAYSDGMVFTCVGTRGIQALNSKTGELIWQNEFEPSEIGSNHTRIVVDGDRIYLNLEGYLHCFNKYTGELQFTIRNGCAGGTVVDENAVYVENDLVMPRKLVSANKYTGEVNWSVELLGRLMQPPVVDGDYVYVSKFRLISPEVHGRLYKLNRHTGEIILEIPVHLPDDDSPNSGPYQSPVIYNDLVIVEESSDLCVFAYNKNTGELEWIYDHGGPIRYAMKEENGVLYFATQDTWMVALSAETGEVIWKDPTMLGSCLKGPVAIYGNYLFTYSSDGNMHCYNKLTGEWQFKEGFLWSPVTHEDTIFVGGAYSTTDQYMSAYKIIIN